MALREQRLELLALDDRASAVTGAGSIPAVEPAAGDLHAHVAPHDPNGSLSRPADHRRPPASKPAAALRCGVTTGVRSDTDINSRWAGSLRVTTLAGGADHSRSRPRDVQAQPPSLAVGLSRVGVTGVEKVIRISNELFWARLECFVDLGPDQKGAHMSRFEEVVNEAIGEVVLGDAPSAPRTSRSGIAELVRERQGALRAEVTIAARYPEHKPAPVSGVNTQEIYTLYGRALASEAARDASSASPRPG